MQKKDEKWGWRIFPLFYETKQPLKDYTEMLTRNSQYNKVSYTILMT